MAIERNKVKPPVLPKETTDSAAIGGEVIVRGLLMSDRMALWALAKPREGETEEQASARAAAGMVPEMLARTVVLADGKPLWTAQQWDEFAASNSTEALRIFSIADKLSGGDSKEIEKN